MANRLYYVNRVDMTALFYGDYNSEPDLVYHPHLRSWLDTFGPANAHYITSDSPPMYPWTDGRGGIDKAWKLWMIYPDGRHNMRPSGAWQAWPTDAMRVLANVPRGRR